MDSVVNQPKAVRNMNVRLIMIVKVINAVKLAHAEMLAYNPDRVVLMPNAVSSIDKLSAHAHHHILETHKSNVYWKRIFAPEIHAEIMLNAGILAAELMNAFAHPIVLEIRIRDANALARS